MGIVKAICISKQRGTPKCCVNKAIIRVGWGIEGDAHGGDWHRQISILSYESIQHFRNKGADVAFGAFGENLVVKGYDFHNFLVGTRFQCNEVVLELTQIGKECHSRCKIYHQMGDCIMPREGVFAKVISGGEIHIGDEFRLLPMLKNRPFRVAVLTLSDKGYSGEREDQSGPLLTSLLTRAGFEVVEALLLPDEQQLIENELIRLADNQQVDCIITTGGTGLSKRDVTPEATISVAMKMVPGIAEAIRAHSMLITKRAMLSRGVSVIRNHTLIINLPGSPKAVKECFDYISSEIPHALEILRGTISDCADV